MLDWDLETDRFGPSNLAPEPICLSMCDGKDRLVVATCEPAFDEVLVHCLEQEQCNTNIAFDMSVILAWRPKVADKVWKAYRDGRVRCLIVREKLLWLSETGDLKFEYLENGAKREIKFSQLAMEQRYLGIDRGEEKEDDDAWRSNYSVLKGIPAGDYPKEAYDYSLADAVNGLRIFHEQEARSKKCPVNSMAAQDVSVRAALALQLSSCWGFPVDHAEVERLFADLSQKYHERHYPLLVQAGILEPSLPARPYLNQMKRAIAEVGGTEPLDWEPHRERLQALGINFSEAKESKYKTAPLKDLFQAVCERTGITPKLTDGGDISTDQEMQETLKGLDETIDEYIDRGEIRKLVTTELPRMRAGRVHPRYDILKKTGRTSSYGNRKQDKNPPYPAVNIQQIDPRVRHAYIASPGHVLCSVDYNFIELVSIAQKCLDVLGHSVLAEKINAGFDPHAYLGADIASDLDPGLRGITYEAFLPLKKSDRKRYDQWRGLAKPTGLGFPGGLGAARFIGYAKSTFGVDLVKMTGSLEAALELAKQLKARWLATYPEMKDYFKWVTDECKDAEWSSPDDDRYAYISPYGMVRRNCHYTEATNGAGLQTPTAEGAKISLWELAQATHDASLGSCLLGCHMVAFIHDEVIVELPEDDLMHERAYEVARIMREGMSRVMTRVKVGAEPALMHRWNKAAEAVFNDKNRLIPWQPPSPQ